VIQATDCDQCDEEGVCDSHFGPDMDNDGDADCYCDPGHVWEDPNDPNNFACDEIEPKPDVNACILPHNVQVGGQCHCACGWNWCSSAADDLSCCPDDSSDCAESDTDVIMTTSPDESSGDSGSTTAGESSTGSGTDTGSGSGSGTDTGMADSGSSEAGSGSGTAE
jgi:hypothetical protein